MKVELPTIFGYESYRKFLSDWFAAKKGANPRFSHRLFARLAGQRSPSLLLQVMQGKRNLTARTTRAFCHAMDFDGEECAHFHDLVAVDQATSEDEAEQARERLSARMRFRDARGLAGDSWSYLSCWYLPAIRELSVCDGWVGEPEWVSAHLRPPIPVAEADRALRQLEELGLLVRDEGGRLHAAEATIATAREVEADVAVTYHLQMLTRAEEAISRFPADHRHLGAVTVAVPEELLPRLKRELSDFQERLLDLCDRTGGAVRQVYQFNIQLFPLADAEPEERAS